MERRPGVGSNYVHAALTALIATLLRRRFAGRDKALPGADKFCPPTQLAAPSIMRLSRPLARADNDDNDGLRRLKDSCRVHIAKRRHVQNLHRFAARRTLRVQCVRNDNECLTRVAKSQRIASLIFRTEPQTERKRVVKVI